MSKKHIAKLSEAKIKVKGARTHNLKNISLEIPRDKLTVISGLSGSGKSSLAFDTLFAEGQRRFVESLSAYARQFLSKMQKPDVDDIEGLSAAISIDQKSRSNNPRSTVATITEIYDYLRVLYARVGTALCMQCKDPIQKLSKEEILDLIYKKLDEFKKDKKEGKKVLGVELDEEKLQIFAPIVRGRKGEYYQILYDFLSNGFEFAQIDGKMHSLREKIILSKNKKHDIDILVDEIYLSEFKEDRQEAEERLKEAIERALDEADGLLKIKLGEKEELLSSKFICPKDGFSFPEIEPRLFSFNSPYGACPTCKGLGFKHFFKDESVAALCDDCQGARLRPEALSVFLKDKDSKMLNIKEFTDLSIKDAFEFMQNLSLSEKQAKIAEPVIREIKERLTFMIDVGIEYLTLNRRANTLSGGEAQRIRLASQLGSRLVGAMYVLDEPTIGLHQRDNDRLIKTLHKLRDLGNTVIVVEHDEDVLLSADFLVDIGPGAGRYGGEVIVSDYLEKLLLAKKNESDSRTLAYLRGEAKIETPKVRRTQDKGSLKVRGASKHNIKNLDLDIPLGRFNVITGVSGSGKSTLMHDILWQNLRARFDRRYATSYTFNAKSFKGTEYIARAILIDQSPIGRTPRSNPATYTGAWTYIRELFAGTRMARERGWSPGRFSFNVKGGRCEACQGNGFIAVEMHFLPTVYVECDVCRGKRFMKETLEVKYKDKNVWEVLEMQIDEALEFFKDIPQIKDRLQALVDTGLGYLKLGQSATTLSGGEAQRVKIASELYRPDTYKTVYLLDEPTVGLHYDDVKKLIEILQKLVDRGNTVIVIEHNLDLIKSADYVIDMGPEGGKFGGQVVAKGTPEQVAKSKTWTGKHLKRVL